MKGKLLYAVSAAAMLAAPFGLASAQTLTLLSNTQPVTFSGTGLGSVFTLLTVQDNDGNEVGCVSRSGGADVLGATLTGTTCTGTGNTQALTQTRTLGEAGITSASQFGILFNASEPGGMMGDGITLNSLTAIFFTPTGTFTAPLVGTPVTFANTLSGVGNSGFLITLAGPLPNALTADTRVGLAANVGCVGTQTATCQSADGGLETFFLVNTGGATSVVPEPSTYALLATGLVAIVGLGRRRRQI